MDMMAASCMRLNCPSDTHDVEYYVIKELRQSGMIMTCRVCGCKFEQIIHPGSGM